jgi:hypothetical protein
MEPQLSKESFRTLCDKVNSVVKSESWWQKFGVDWGVAGLRFLVFLLGYGIFVQVGVGYRIIGMIIMSYGLYALCLTGFIRVDIMDIARDIG